MVAGSATDPREGPKPRTLSRKLGRGFGSALSFWQEPQTMKNDDLHYRMAAMNDNRRLRTIQRLDRAIVAVSILVIALLITLLLLLLFR